MSKLEKGNKAPDFSRGDQEGNTVTLSQYAGKKMLVYFYPKANTPGCTKQACAVRDALSDLKEYNIFAVGVSPDAPKAQLKFAQKYTLGFPLLSDEDHSMAQAYGVWGEKSMYGKKYMGIIRSAFLIDEDGNLMDVWYKVSPKDTVPNALKAVEEL